MQLVCPACGRAGLVGERPPPANLFRPWSLETGRSAVRAYVRSLGEEAREWLLALYVDADLRLLSVETVSCGDPSRVEFEFWPLLDRGKAVGAAGFVLVHNHPSGDARPSTDDIRITRRLAHISRELDLPLLDHLIVTASGMLSVGEW